MNELSRLKEAIKKLKEAEIVKDQAEVAADLGYRRAQSVSDILTGRAALTTKFVKSFCIRYGIDEEWVRGNSDNMFLPGYPKSSDNNNKPTGEQLRLQKALGKNANEERGLIYVPIAAQMGYARAYTDPVYISHLQRLFIPGLPYKGDKYRYFEGEGDSMEPTIIEGMQVIGEFVEPEDWKNAYDYYIYVILTESRLLIKRIFKKDADNWVLVSDNSDYPQELFKVAEIKELWYVKRILDWRMPPPKRIEITV